MALPTYVIEADVDGDGTYEENLSSRISERWGGTSIRRGMDESGIYQISELALTLDNIDRRFTPENSASALFGKMRPGVDIRGVATHNAIPYTLWRGYVQRWGPVEVTLEQQTAALRASDLAEYLRMYEGLNVTSSTTRRTDQALEAIFAAMGIGASLYQLDVGKQSLPLHFARAENALGAVMRAVQSEMGGLFWVTKAGKLRFESRGSRLGATPDQTWGDGTNILPVRKSYLSDNDEFVTRVTVQAAIFVQDQDQQEIFRFSRSMDNNPADSLALTAGEIYEAEFHYSAPAVSVAAPVASTDYLANSAQDGSGTDKTSALTVAVTDLGAGFRLKLTNTDAGTIYVTTFRLRGTVDTFVADRPQFVASKSVVGQITDIGVNIDVPFADDTGQKPRDYSIGVLRTQRYPVPRLVLEFDLDVHDDIAVALLSVEIGDLIKFKDTLTGQHSLGVDDWWYVESLNYAIAAARVTQCEVMLAPSYAYRDLDKIIYDLFTRADTGSGLGTALKGGAWATSTGFKILSNQAAPVDAATYITTLDLAAADGAFELSLSGLTTSGIHGIVYRYADDNNYLHAFVNQNVQEITLRKVVAGVVSTLAYFSRPRTTTAEMRVLVQGTRHRVWVDRKLWIDVTDGDLAANTKAGIYTLGNAAARFDDWYGAGL